MATEVSIVVSRDDAGRLMDELLQLEEIKTFEVSDQVEGAKYPLQLDPHTIVVMFAIEVAAGISAIAAAETTKRIRKRLGELLANAVGDGIKIREVHEERKTNGLHEKRKTIDLIGLDKETAARYIEKALSDSDESTK
jgi:hypothetical protein